MSYYQHIVLALMITLLAGCTQPASPPLEIAVASSPTTIASPTVAPTFTTTPSPTPISTSTPTPTATPSPTNIPTETATPTPFPTDTPVPTATPIPPTATSTDTPPPSVDFRVASWRLWPLELNSGCAKGMHTIFITVLDANGAPLDNIVVGDSWNNVETMTGSKGQGKAEIDLWSNTMEMVVKRDGATGQPYTSEVSFPFSSFMTTIPNEQMIQAGYCANEADCEWKRANDSYYCGGHYSWEVIFQKTH